MEDWEIQKEEIKKEKKMEARPGDVAPHYSRLSLTAIPDLVGHPIHMHSSSIPPSPAGDCYLSCLLFSLVYLMKENNRSFQSPSTKILLQTFCAPHIFYIIYFVFPLLLNHHIFHSLYLWILYDNWLKETFNHFQLSNVEKTKTKRLKEKKKIENRLELCQIIVMRIRSN